VLRFPSTSTLPLPLYLVSFGILFDLLTALGRVSFGVDQAFATRYTMPNLVLVTGIGLFAWESLELDVPTILGAGRGRHVGRVVLGGVLCTMAVVQIVHGTQTGLNAARADQATKDLGDRVVVNLASIPQDKRTQLVYSYVSGNTSAIESLAAQARAAQIGPFAPPFYQQLLEEGPP